MTNVTIDRAKILEQMSSHQTPAPDCRQELEALVRSHISHLTSKTIYLTMPF